MAYFWNNFDSPEDDNQFLIHQTEILTYRETFEIADSIFSEFSDDLILILADKNVETIIAYVGALRSSLVVMMLDSAVSPDVLQASVDSYCPKYIFTCEKRSLDGFKPVRNFRSGQLLRRDSSPNRRLHPDLKLLMPTSGSTGDPKCVRVSADNMAFSTSAITSYLQMNNSSRSITTLPLHYTYGLSVLNNTMGSRGSIVISSASVVDKEFWRLMRESEITILSGVPLTFEMMKRKKITAESTPSLSCVTQAGGRLSEDLTRHFAEVFSGIGIRYYTMYGQTEASPRISFVPPDRAIEKLGSVGLPIPGGHIEIKEPDENGIGELVYRGRNVCMGYATGRADLGSGDDFHGELHTGDLGLIDEDGYIFLTGRKKRQIKIYGVSVNLDSIESWYHANGIQCAALGMDEEIILATVSDDEVLLKKLAKERFNFYLPALKFQRVDSLLYTSSGKLDYPRLYERFMG